MINAKFCVALLVMTTGFYGRAETADLEKFLTANCRIHSVVSGMYTSYGSLEKQTVTFEHCRFIHLSAALMMAAVSGMDVDGAPVYERETLREERGIIEHRVDKNQPYQHCAYHVTEGVPIPAWIHEKYPEDLDSEALESLIKRKLPGLEELAQTICEVN